jgi:tetratricopeptide (TPR) repeat protein
LIFRLPAATNLVRGHILSFTYSFKKTYFHLEKKEYTEAEKKLQQILKIDPDNNLARYYLLQVYRNTGNFDRTINVSNELLEKYPDYITAYLEKGYAAIKIKNYNLAIDALEKALELDTQSRAQKDAIEVNLAEAYFLNQNYEKAALLYRKIYEKTGEAEMLYKAALALKKQGQIDEAFKLFVKLTGASDISENLMIKVYLELGRISISRKDLQNTVNYYLKCLEIDPDNPEALRAVANGYFSLGDFEKSLVYTKKVIAFDESFKTLRLLGMVYYQMKDYSRAVKTFHRALDLPVTRAQQALLKKFIGQCYLNQKDLYKASSYFRGSLKDRFDEETAVLYISVLSQMHKWNRLIKEGEKLLRGKKISPEISKKIKLELLYAYKNSGRNKKYFHLSLELLKEAPDFYLEAANAAKRIHKLDSAIKFYKKYLNVNFRPDVALDLYYILIFF